MFTNTVTNNLRNYYIGGIQMKQNDYPIIKYQALQIMYEKIKKHEPLSKDDISEVRFGINIEYWQYIFTEMKESGLISVPNNIVPHPNFINQFAITPSGINYLFIDPLMKEAKEYVDGRKKFDD